MAQILYAIGSYRDYDRRILNAFVQLDDLVSDDIDLYRIADYLNTLFDTNATVDGDLDTTTTHDALYQAYGRIFGKEMMARISKHGKFSTFDALTSFVDAQIKDLHANILGSKVVVALKSRTQANKAMRKYISVINNRNEEYAKDLQGDLTEHDRARLSKEQLAAAMYVHHNLSKGWRPLTLVERFAYRDGTREFYAGGKMRIPMVVFTDELAVTLCSDEDIAKMYAYLEKDGLFTHADAKWLMDRGWLGKRLVLAAIVAAFVTTAAQDVDARHKHRGKSPSAHHQKSSKAKHKVDKPTPVKISVITTLMKPAEERKAFPVDPTPSVIDAQNNSGSSHLGRNLALGVGGAGLAAAGVLTAKALKKRKRKQDDGYDELSNNLQALDKAITEKQVTLQCALDGATRDRLEGEKTALLDRRADLVHLMWFSQYWKQYSAWANTPLTYRQLMAILAAHKLPGGYRVLDTFQGSVDVQAVTEHMVFAKDGRRLVTTGTPYQNSAKFLRIKNANVALTDAQIDWVLHEGGAGKPEGGVGGVTWEGLVAGKSSVFDSFYFENIPDIGEINSMGFNIDAIFRVTIGSLL
jgi:hypothetical protein